MFLNIWPYRPIRRLVTQGRVTFRSHTWAMAQRNDGGSRSGVAPLQRGGKTAILHSHPRQDTETKGIDHHLNKRISLWGARLSRISLFLFSPKPRAALTPVALLSVLTVIMWILDNHARERTNTFVTRIGKRHLSPRICSRDLTIPRRDMTPVSRCPGLARATGESRAENSFQTELFAFEGLLSASVEKTVRVSKTLESFNFALRRIRYFHPLFLRATTVCGKLARMVPKSFLVVCGTCEEIWAEEWEICKKKGLQFFSLQFVLQITLI